MLKGHTVLLPQDTTYLLDLLLMSPLSLPNIIHVIWTGKLAPEKKRLRSHFTICKQKVYDILKWLCVHHEDYHHITIDEQRLSTWESTFVVIKLLDSIAHVADLSTEDALCSSFTSEDPDAKGFEGNIPFNISGILDMNNVTLSPHVSILERLAHSKRQAWNQSRGNSGVEVTVKSSLATRYWATNITPPILHLHSWHSSLMALANILTLDDLKSCSPPPGCSCCWNTPPGSLSLSLIKCTDKVVGDSRHTQDMS